MYIVITLIQWRNIQEPCGNELFGSQKSLFVYYHIYIPKNIETKKLKLCLCIKIVSLSYIVLLNVEMVFKLTLYYTLEDTLYY